MAKTKINDTQKTAQEFINVIDIKDNLLFSKDGYVFGYISVRASSDKLMSPSERKLFFENMVTKLESEKDIFQLITIPKTIDVIAILNNLLKLKNKGNTDAKLKLINGEIDFMKQMVLEDTKEPIIIIKMWEKISKNNYVNFKKRLSDLEKGLNEIKISAKIMDNVDIGNMCKIYSELNIHQYDDEDEEEVAANKTKEKKMKVNNDLLNMITPVGGLDFKIAQTIIGSTVGKIYTAIKYPTELPHSWLTKIMNCTEAITAITYYPTNVNTLADGLSKSINRNLGDAGATRDARERKQLEKQAIDADNALTSLDEKNDAVGFISITTMPFCDDEDKLLDVCRRVETLFRAQKIKLKCLGNLQKEGFKVISPYYTNQDIVDVISKRLFPLASLMGGSPLVINSYKDDDGYYFATTVDGNKIILNLFGRSSDRTNSNMVIMGKSGTGKSTAIKSIIETMYMRGIKIIVIDPEREYKELCENLGGTWIDAGGGNSKINILQIRVVPSDDEDDKTNRLYNADETESALVGHMRTLEILFSTYIPSLTSLQTSKLKKTLIELYEKWNITWDTDITNFKPTDFPIISDLYELVKSKISENKEYEIIESLIYDMAYGADSFVFNGHTNVNLDGDFICFDTKKLNEASPNLKRAQYFNLTSMSWDIMSRNRDEPVMLFCDEAYLMIDPELPQSLMFLRNVSKRCRKYLAGLAIISHQLVDFNGEKVKMYGQALIDMPTYKLLFGTDAQNLKDTVTMFDLSPAEKEILQNGRQQHCLACFGSQRMHIIFNLPQYKIDLMGKGGGV